MNRKVVLTLTIFLVLLLIITSCVGIFVPGFYKRESFNWQIQSIGQDIVDLCIIAPTLLLSAILVYRKKQQAMFIWSGTVLYTIYTFVIYCFDVHFNRLFILYCLTLGLAFYSLLYFLYTQVTTMWKEITKRSVINTIGIYFVVLPVIFYFLWLSMVIPAVFEDNIPKDLADIGLFTNPVHVIDLAIFLPGLLITGVMVLKRKPLSVLLVPMLLSFFILMDITIGWLAFMMHQNGLASDLSVTVVMSILAIMSLVLLIWYLKNIKLPTASLQLEVKMSML